MSGGVRRKRGRPRRGEGTAIDDLDLMLAREFQQRPAFYDRSHPQYRNRDYLEGMWSDMSEVVGVNVAVVKNRMVQLRNRYNLEKRRVEMLQDQYNDPSITSQWPMYNYLTYLGDHIKSRRSFTKEVIARPKSAPFSNSSDSDECEETNNPPSYQSALPSEPCTPAAVAPATNGNDSNEPANSASQITNTNNYDHEQLQTMPLSQEQPDDFNSNSNLTLDYCKFRAFGQFLSSSLMEMNECDALNLVEKFTSDLVKSLLLESSNNNSYNKQPDAQFGSALVNGHI